MDENKLKNCSRVFSKIKEWDRNGGIDHSRLLQSFRANMENRDLEASTGYLLDFGLIEINSASNRGTLYKMKNKGREISSFKSWYESEKEAAEYQQKQNTELTKLQKKYLEKRVEKIESEMDEKYVKMIKEFHETSIQRNKDQSVMMFVTFGISILALLVSIFFR